MTEPTPVVTCFLRHEAEVLLLRRAPDASTYPGRWGAVSGYVEGGDPSGTARMEIEEETGRTDATPVRRGEPFVVEDGERAFRVHPFLFATEGREVVLNDEATAAEWVPPTAIRRRETVPELWRSYDAVRPTPETIRDDTEHGAAALSIRGLEVLRDTAAVADDMGTVRATARSVLAARPSMAVLGNRIDRAMAGADTPGAVEAAASEGIGRAFRVDRDAAAAAAEALPSGEVMTLSRSGTVLRALERLDSAVVIAESRPGREGIEVAETLAERGRSVTVCPDAAAASVLAGRDVAAVLVGADTLLPDGRVVNKVGTRGIAVAAAREGVPVHVVTASDKLLPEGDPRLEAGPPEAVYDGEAPIGVENPTFDVTPADAVTAVWTERGRLAPGDLDALADELRRNAAWRDRGDP